MAEFTAVVQESRSGPFLARTVVGNQRVKLPLDFWIPARQSPRWLNAGNSIL
jgi:hypothetical protein